MLTITEGLVAVGAVANLFAIAVAIYKLGGAVQKFEMIGRQQSSEISALKDAVKVTNDLMVQVALSSQKQEFMQGQISRIDRVLEELKRGNGFILPSTSAL